MALIGYLRVSTDDQNEQLQEDALNAAGCVRIYRDLGVSAISKKRPGFEALLDELLQGDTLVVWKVDRAFRSTKQAIITLEGFEARGIALRSLTEHVDTRSPMGYAMFQMQNVYAELERKLIGERTRAGLSAAKRRGRRLGRPRRLSTERVLQARTLLANGRVTHADIALHFGVSSRTLARALTQIGEQVGSQSSIEDEPASMRPRD